MYIGITVQRINDNSSTKCTLRWIECLCKGSLYLTSFDSICVYIYDKVRFRPFWIVVSIQFSDIMNTQPLPTLNWYKHLDLWKLSKLSNTNLFPETIRKYPGLPILNRECTKTYQIPNSKYVIEEGTAVVISLMGLHRDPEYFPDPLKFMPERFLDGQRNCNDVAYFPFGEGPRTCIGE